MAEVQYFGARAWTSETLTMKSRFFISLSLVLLGSLRLVGQVIDGQFPVESNLKAGVAKVEYGFKLEKAIADRATPIIVGYANGNIGYLATADAHTVGGYEPNMSKVKPEAEAIILKQLGVLADKVVGDVFASFSKHPRDVEKREAEEKARLDAAKQVKP